MKPRRVWAFGLSALGCAFAGFDHDPHAVTPGYDRWEASVPTSPDSAYVVALAVVVQSGYLVATASGVDRVITTHLRHVELGTGLSAESHDVRFTVAVLPIGADSARLSVTGDSCWGDGLSSCRVVTARYDGGSVGPWQLVRRLGEATLSPPGGRVRSRQDGPAASSRR
ncbi:MAG TPA: hypothetical protein VLB49_10645 [Gemmatimonadales bacterium]|nr:hypothetical protein [Gemmatimonadales bacterium]